MGIREIATKIKGGINVPHFKNTAESESVKMTSPSVVILPLQQHIGAPCQPTVKIGDQLAVGQVVGDSEAFISTPIHATVSGIVKAISPYALSHGKYVDAIHIESDGKDTMYSEIVKRPEVKSRDNFLHAVRQSGIVGMGGAGFPTHAKLTLKDGINVDTLIVNGAECEPYITADYRDIMENNTHLLDGIEWIMEYIGIQNCIIGIENNKPKAISLLVEKIAALDMQGRVSVMKLPANYPYGAEKVLVHAVTGRTISLGRLPSDVGAIVLNVSTISALSHYLETGIPLTHKRITVDGSAITKPQNVIAPIGTPIRDIVSFCGGYMGEPDKVIIGGPMMGTAESDDSVPIFKANNAVLCLTSKETYRPKDKACIRCSRCIQACPMNLVPNLIEQYAERSNFEMLKKLSVSGCMECGSCAYVCPAKRSLIQSIRKAKQIEKVVA